MNEQQIEKLNEKAREHQGSLNTIIENLASIVFGAESTSRSLLRAILSSGHVLLEGLPGLAKTMLADSFARLLSLDFKRIQFTPDLLPADVTGGEVLNMKEGEFYTRKGPLFTNILLADEINRAPAKVQSALLEAMAEKKITIGLETFRLDEPFMVMATQNPVEQEGTYPLPEAQTDRFMFKVLVEYPNKNDELRMLDTHSTGKKIDLQPCMSREDILELRQVCDSVYADERLKNYIVDLVQATRNLKETAPEIAGFVDFGASPRASLALLRGARANAVLDGRGFAIPEDVREIAHETLRHRLILSYNALAEDIDSNLILNTLLQKIEVP